MAFFDPNISNGMQFITLPAEITGITLTFLEFKFPQLSQAVNHAWNTSLKNVDKKWDFVSWWKYGKPDPKRPGERIGLLRSRLEAVINIVLAFLLLFLSLTAFYNAITTQKFGIIDVLIIALALIGIIWATGKRFWQFSSKILPARPLGALGILIASMGVIGEMYQMSVLLIFSPTPVYIISMVLLILFMLAIFTVNGVKIRNFARDESDSATTNTAD